MSPSVSEIITLYDFVIFGKPIDNLLILVSDLNTHAVEAKIVKSRSMIPVQIFLSFSFIKTRSSSWLSWFFLLSSVKQRQEYYFFLTQQNYLVIKHI